MSGDLAAWISERYDEAEALANAALGGTDGTWQMGYRSDEYIRFAAFDAHQVRGGAIDEDTLRHIALKRAILTLHKPELIEVINADQDERSGVFCSECSLEVYPCPTVRQLGTEFIDREGYRPEWAPE